MAADMWRSAAKPHKSEQPDPDLPQAEGGGTAQYLLQRFRISTVH
jgi:hypothetical protein